MSDGDHGVASVEVEILVSGVVGDAPALSFNNVDIEKRVYVEDVHVIGILLK